VSDGARAGDRRRFALLLCCLAASLALYGALAVLLSNVPAGWDSKIRFSAESGPMFRAFNGLPAVAFSPAGFERGMVAVIAALWAVWGGAALALRGIAGAELRRRAALLVVVGAAAMLLLIVFYVPTTLSSDLYRQAAYGRMVVHYHLNPYASPVNAIPGDPVFALAIHRHLTTHYGAAYTLLSALAAAVAPSSALGAALAWKLMSACAAVGCALLIGPVVRALGGGEADGQNARIWLAWNPLLLVESAASGRVGPIMMAAALAGILSWRRPHPVRGAVVLVVSALTKWLSGLLLFYAAVWEIARAEAGRRMGVASRLAGAAVVTAALLYAPFAGGLGRRGGISDIAMRGAETVGNAPVIKIPQWALLAGFAALVVGAVRFVARGDWPRLVATTAALLLVFVMLVNPWPFPWYFLSPLVLAAALPAGRAGFVLRALSAGMGAMMTMFLYTRRGP
jgi:hypothetical protein